MAQRTGLEPATPGVTGRYSNRLNYRCVSVDLRPVLREKVLLPITLPLLARRPQDEKIGLANNGAADGTRTRDPRRDRPVF